MDSTINRSYTTKFKIENQSDVQESLHLITNQEKILDLKNSNERLNDAIAKLMDCQKQYRGFESNDLEIFHENHFVKLNQRLAENNRKLEAFVGRFKGIVEVKEEREEGGEEAREKYRALKKQLSVLKKANKAEMKVIKESYKEKVNGINEDISSVVEEGVKKLPVGFVDLVGKLRFEKEQVERVGLVGESVKNIVGELRKAAEDNNDVRRVNPDDQAGKDISEYDFDNINLDYGETWKKVYETIKEDCSGLENIRSDLMTLNEYINQADKSAVFERSTKKRGRENADDVYSVKYCFQGQKRYFGFNEEDYSIANWKKEVLKGLIQDPESLKLYIKSADKELDISNKDKLSQYTGKTIFLVSK